MIMHQPINRDANRCRFGGFSRARYSKEVCKTKTPAEKKFHERELRWRMASVFISKMSQQCVINISGFQFGQTL